MEKFLEESFKYSAEYKEQLANHLPMTIIALIKMGASEERIKSFIDFYSSKLELKDQAEGVIKTHNWKDFLGNHKRNTDYVNFFRDEVKEHGVEKVLKTYLDPLMEGVGGGAFHPLIRVAYGVESGCKREICEGLASWCMAYLFLLPVGTYNSSYEKVTDAFIEITKDPYLKNLKVKGSNIFTRMEIVGEDRNFKRFSNSLPKREIALEEISLAAIKLYASTNDNFEALHVVTSSHALRVLKPYFLNFDGCLRFYWQAVCAVYITIGSPEISEVKKEGLLPEWNIILEKACLSNNDHIIKFAYSCWEEEKCYGGTLYRQCASKKVGLL